ncbi:hypothetical protein CAQU_01100 [Corynebacterium aquilae DSM 44791]|uniref:DUF2516 family protein n=2 Tax=Corynebacterium aquilae TaxID=203263 RepID=A0A1L7CDN8_9CORY|nr:hypothetical protein CAQU_01100 [Corynebacterium aquilae DSM 44791]
MLFMYFGQFTDVAFYILRIALALVAGWGAITAALTRADAFEVAGRQAKPIWVAILGICTVVMIVPFRMSILAIVACVFIGIYWFDVRPQLKEILNNSGGW